MTKTISAIIASAILAACSGPLPLEERILKDETTETENEITTRATSAFGNWVVICAHVDKLKYRAKDQAWCSVSPWKGQISRGQPVRLSGRAVVETAPDRPPQIRITFDDAASGSDFTLKCGGARVSDTTMRHKFLYDKDAAPFLSQMRRKDCALEYVPQGGAESVVQTISANGFKEALEFGNRFVKQAR